MKYSWITIICLVYWQTSITMEYDPFKDMDLEYGAFNTFLFEENITPNQSNNNNNNTNDIVDIDFDNFCNSIFNTQDLNQPNIIPDPNTQLLSIINNPLPAIQYQEYASIQPATSQHQASSLALNQPNIFIDPNTQPLSVINNPIPEIQNKECAIISPPAAPQNQVPPLANPAPIKKKITHDPNIEARKIFPCKVCGKKFTTPYNRRDHQIKCEAKYQTLINNNNNASQIIEGVSSQIATSLAANIITQYNTHDTNATSSITPSDSSHCDYSKYLSKSFITERSRLWCTYPECKQFYREESYAHVLNAHRLTHHPDPLQRLPIACSVAGCLRRFAQDYHRKNHEYQTHGVTGNTQCTHNGNMQLPNNNDDND